MALTCISGCLVCCSGIILVHLYSGSLSSLWRYIIHWDPLSAISGGVGVLSGILSIFRTRYLGCNAQLKLKVYIPV